MEDVVDIVGGFVIALIPNLVEVDVVMLRLIKEIGLLNLVYLDLP